MITFLKGRADLLKKLELSKNTYRVDKQTFKNSKQSQSFVVSNNIVYTFCKDTHKIYNCPKFLELSVNARINHVKTSRLCTNCLHSGHFSAQCKYGFCKKCKAKHHTTLHMEREVDQSDESEKSISVQPKQQASFSNYTNFGQTVLSTAIIQILDKDGKTHNCRALLDCGSQSNFITADLSQRLGLTKSSVDISVVGISQTVFNIRSKCIANIQSQPYSFLTSLTCLVVPTICDRIPIYSFDIRDLNIPKHLKLADPAFHMASKVDFLENFMHWQTQFRPICSCHAKN